MANHGKIHCRKTPKPEQIEAKLQELCKTKFKDYVGVRPMTDREHGWALSVQGVPKFHDGSVLIWIRSPRVLETRHQFSSDFMWWVSWTICHELGVLFNGMLSDEGVSERWKPVHNKYPTFLDYHKMKWSRTYQQYPVFAHQLLKLIPKPLRTL